MKKVFIHLFVLGLFLGFAASAQAQPGASVTIGDEVDYVGSTVLVPLNAVFSAHPDSIVRSFEFRIVIGDQNVISFNEEKYIHPIFGTVTVIEDTDGPDDYIIFWTYNEITPDAASGFDGKILDLEFVILQEGVSTIEFVDPNEVGRTEIGGGTGTEGAVADPFPAVFNNGSVTGIAPPIPLKSWSLILGLVLISGFLATRLIRIL